jgi:GNAT superfamily N-acetyltransferase
LRRGLKIMAELLIDLARESDIADLNLHIAQSAQTLCARYYEPGAVSAAITHVFGVDSQLVEAGCYFIARLRGEIIACGGWSPFATMYGSDNAAGRDDRQLNPAHEAARIRAFFVAPDWTRAGVGSVLLETCENAAFEAGYGAAELMATLSGVPFYAARGYVAGKEHVVNLGGMRIRFVAMRKSPIAAIAGRAVSTGRLVALS